jgi:hypothetical protein
MKMRSIAKGALVLSLACCAVLVREARQEVPVPKLDFS